MNHRRFLPPGLLHRLALLILVIAYLSPLSTASAADSSIVVVEDPQLNPPYTTCPLTYWYPIPNDRGHTAYLTLNTAHSTNSGEWHPSIPQAGYYRVEAYIADHDPIAWCTSGNIKDHDTSEAHYTIYSASGETARTVSQYPLSNQWVSLGEFYFNAGSAGYVKLTDLNGETEYTTTVSFSAMRFTLTQPLYMPSIYYSDPSGKPLPDTGVIQGQGFDACYLPSVDKMQTWWDHSPYSFFGLYLGGIHFASFCTKANSTWVKAVHAQGWSFIPTWVGPQAPCTDYNHKISSDPATAYQQGRQEAQAASAAAAAVGLTNYGWGGTVIYYDMENFDRPSSACRQATASFMNGWDERLLELGNFSGGYGAQSSYVQDWAYIQNVPTDVWAASWYADAYDPNASVNGISWLNGLWIHHQRLRQYAGDHTEHWGNVGIGIDNDVADGMVAMPPSNLLATPVVTSSPSISDGGWLSDQQGWLVTTDHLYWTKDAGASWLDISPAPTKLAYFLPGGHAWAISNPNQGVLSLYHSTDQGSTWEDFDLSLPDGSWWPKQLHFSSPTDGWMVLQKVTSQAFSAATLLKTTDGGLTWKSFELPIMGAVTFTSPLEGWLRGSEADQVFHTTDGGFTWTKSALNADLLSKPIYPQGVMLSSWQNTTTGWAATTQTSCTGEKSSSVFACQVDHAAWQTLDGGQTWSAIPLPLNIPVKR
jgi:photosystem II stability/assembly factor-like uncharacterized protein